MLMITSFANPRVAQAFVDYMATQGDYPDHSAAYPERRLAG
jgi:hypothetical protein